MGSEQRGRTGAADGGLKSPPKPVIRSLPFFHSFSLWLINSLKNCDCTSYCENGKDKVVKRHSETIALFSACIVLCIQMRCELKELGE